MTALSSQCINAMPNFEELVPVILEWAGSLHREGDYRIHLATRLLRRWYSSDSKIDIAIVVYLREQAPRSAVDVNSIFRIVAELVRSRHFNVGRYLQWLIASGATSQPAAGDSNTPLHLRVLGELPVYAIPPHVLNLRQSVLHTLGLESSKNESVEQLKAVFDALSSPVASVNGQKDWLANVDLEKFSLDAKLSSSASLRAALLRNVQWTKDAPPRISITASQFFIARDVLEQVEDIPVLADVLAFATTSDEPLLLASVVDTLNYHRRTLEAVGALRPIFKRLTERYLTIRLQRPPERQLYVALANLCDTIGEDSRVAAQLRSDLARYEQKVAVAMCSPASDNMAEIMASSETVTNPDEEIDRILASGTSMDEQIMARVFQRIMQRMDQTEVEYDSNSKPSMDVDGWHEINEFFHGKKESKSNDTSSKFCPWFQRLRAFDERVFDQLVIDWIAALTREELRNAKQSGTMRSRCPDSSSRLKQGSALKYAVPVLVGSGCFSLETFVRRFQDAITDLVRNQAFLPAIDFLQVLWTILLNTAYGSIGLPIDVCTSICSLSCKT